jgi:RNA polymerase sigma-70 factor (ECF subfamily)
MPSPQPRLHECVRAFESQFGYVHRMLRRQGVPPADVEDLAQEVFIVMWRRWSEFDRQRALRPWLAGIAFNVVGSHLRRPRREVPLADVDITDPAPQGEEVLAAARAKRIVLRALERLPEAYRAVLVLRDIDGMPMRQIAALHGVPLFTAYTRLRKARRDFANVIKFEMSGPSRRPAWLAWPAVLRRALIASLIAVPAVALLWLVRPARPDQARLVAPVVTSLAHGLVGYWRLDDGGGTTARDLSGAGRDCVLHHPGQPWARGRLGGALALDARGWLTCPQPALVDGAAGGVTFAAWIDVRSLPARGNRAVATRELGAGADDHFFFGFVDGRLTLNSTSWGLAIHHDGPWPRGWHHVAFTKSPQATALFLDGAPVGRQPIRRPLADPVDTPLLIGGGSNIPGVVRELLDGAVDEIALYDRALDTAEIAALAGGTQPDFDRRPD